jgi:hypothetical protein
VRRHLFDLVVLLLVATVVATYLALSEPSFRSITLRVYVFVLGGLAMLALVAAAGDAVPGRRRSELDAALSERAPTTRALPELERMQREVTLSTASAYDLHYRLLPHLREIAQARLERSGKSAGPDTLGEWWPLLRPDREPPEDRFGSGITLNRLRALVHFLDTIR